MIGLLRRLLGIDRFEGAVRGDQERLEAAVPTDEERHRIQALQSARAARELARRLRDEDLRREFALRAAVIRRARR